MTTMLFPLKPLPVSLDGITPATKSFKTCNQRAWSLKQDYSDIIDHYCAPTGTGRWALFVKRSEGDFGGGAGGGFIIAPQYQDTFKVSR